MPAAARSCLLFVLLQTVSAGGGISLQALYDDRRWFELREAIRGKNVHPLYRGATASAFHDVRQAEQYLKAAVRGASDPGEAEEAHLVLASLYTRLGRPREAARQYEYALRISPERRDLQSARELFAAFSRHGDQSARGKRRTTLRWTRHAAGMTLPVNVNGRNVRWIVDTGMNITAVAASEASLVGAAVQNIGAKAVDLAGGAAPVQAAVAKRLRIGSESWSCATFPCWSCRIHNRRWTVCHRGSGASSVCRS